MAMVALLGVIAVACARETSVGDIDDPPAALERLPKKAVASCRSVPNLASACPTKVPEIDAPMRWYDWHSEGMWGFIVEAGEPDGSTVPPDAAELHVFSGDELQEPARNLRHAPNFERPMKRRWRPWLLDDQVTWAGRTGDVLVWPEDPGGTHSDHVSFDWTDGDLTYRVSLEAWRPLGSSVATLRAIVRSIGNRTDRSPSR